MGYHRGRKCVEDHAIHRTAGNVIRRAWINLQLIVAFVLLDFGVISHLRPLRTFTWCPVNSGIRLVRFSFGEGRFQAVVGNLQDREESDDVLWRCVYRVHPNLVKWYNEDVQFLRPLGDREPERRRLSQKRLFCFNLDLGRAGGYGVRQWTGQNVTSFNWGNPRSLHVEIAGDSGGGTMWLRAITLPFWVPVLVFGAHPALVLIPEHWQRYRRWWRRRKGLCLTCGYNLTGNTSGICPECGEPTATEDRGGGRVEDVWHDA